MFTASQSTTFKTLSGYSWDISYADGSGASGTVGTDTVTIGGTTVKGQAVELATKVSSSFVSDGSDGLVGLSFSNINTGKFNIKLLTLLRTNKLQSPQSNKRLSSTTPRHPSNLLSSQPTSP